MLLIYELCRNLECKHNLTFHIYRFCGETGPHVRPADPPQLHQGSGPLHEGGTQDVVKGEGRAATLATLASLKNL